MRQKVIRAGKHSLAVIVPAKFTHALGVKAGDWAYVSTNLDNAKVSIRFTGVTQLPLITPSKKKK